jgi:phage terminase large subunit
MAKPAGGKALKFSDRVGKALFSGARHIAFFGGRGSGKSTDFAVLIVTEAEKRKIRVLCCRQHMPSIRESSKQLIEATIMKLGLEANWRMTERSLEHVNGSEILFLGLAVNPDSLRSYSGIDILWVDEAQTINERSFNNIIPTVRDAGSQCLWGWNPDQPSDPVDRFFRGPNPPKNAIVLEVSWRDNPGFHATELPQEMEHLKHTNPDRYKNVWEGAYDQRYERRVFPDNVAIGRPTEADFENIILVVYGLDFGFASDPSVIVKLYVIRRPGRRNVVYVAASVGAHGLPTRELPGLLDSILHDPNAAVMADNSRPETIEDLCARGYDIRPVKKYPGSLRDGIEELRGCDLLVDPDCPEVHQELIGYAWQVDDRTGQILNKLNPKGADHYCDAIRYALSALEAGALLADGGEERWDGGGVLYFPLARARRRYDNPFGS